MLGDTPGPGAPLTPDAFHRAIDEKLKFSRGDRSVLTPKERHFARAYAFNAHVQSGGLEAYFWAVDSHEQWVQALEALRAVGADGYADVFERLLDHDGEAIVDLINGDDDDADDEEGMPFSEAYDEQLLAARDGGDPEEQMLYMERLLTQFIAS